MHDLFREERLLVERQHRLVGEDVVHVLGAGRSRISEIVDLDRSRPTGENARPKTFGQAVQIDGDMHLPIVQQLGDVAIGVGCDVVEPVERLDDACPNAASVIGAE